MRRLLRWLFDGLCLLSLLACLAAAWLWRWEKRGGTPWAEVVAVRTHVLFLWEPAGLLVSTVRHWPEGLGVRAGGNSADCYPYPVMLPAAMVDDFIWPSRDGKTYRGRLGKWREPPIQHMRFAGVDFTFVEYYAVYLRADGTAARLTKGEFSTVLKDPSRNRWSDPMPRYIIEGIPPWLHVGLFALPPLLWLALRSRRLIVRRRRHRVGLCLRCGYDLTGNASGKCSECGEAVYIDGRATAWTGKGEDGKGGRS